jgi:hypothetical protein
MKAPQLPKLNVKRQENIHEQVLPSNRQGRAISLHSLRSLREAELEQSLLPAPLDVRVSNHMLQMRTLQRTFVLVRVADDHSSGSARRTTASRYTS